jgi:DnaJ-class molecular chaperone
MTTENKKICPKCRGNGFIKCNVEEGRVSVVVQCDLCNSKGEVYDKEFDDYFDSYVELKPLLKRRSN